MLKSDLWDYSDVDIVATGATDLLPAAASENVYHFQKDCALKNSALFSSCI